MQQLQGTTALVAGGGRNNGKAIALAFAREGADLMLVAREKKAELDQVAHDCEKLGAKALPLLADVSDHEQVNRMVQQGLDHFGMVDVLMSVAGRRAHQDFWEISYEEWHKTLAVNLHSTFYLAKALAPSMMKRGKGAGGHTAEEPAGVALRRTGKPDVHGYTLIPLARNDSMPDQRPGPRSTYSAGHLNTLAAVPCIIICTSAAGR